MIGKTYCDIFILLSLPSGTGESHYPTEKYNTTSDMPGLIEPVYDRKDQLRHLLPVVSILRAQGNPTEKYNTTSDMSGLIEPVYDRKDQLRHLLPVVSTLRHRGIPLSH